MDENRIEAPQWYEGSGHVTCIEMIKECMSHEMYEGFLEGNVIKYVWRWKDKGGKEDLLKAKKYLEWLIEEA